MARSTSEFEATVLRLRRRLVEAALEYRWLHGAGFGSSGAFIGGRSTDVSKPVEQALADKRKVAMRRRAEAANELLDGLERSVESLLAECRLSYRHRDLVGGPEPRRTTNEGELAASREAKARREARGESYGEA